MPPPTEHHLAQAPIRALPLTFPSLEYRPDLVDAATNCTRTELKHPSDHWILVTTHAAVMHKFSLYSSPLLSQPSTLPGSVTTLLFQLRSEVSTSANARPGVSSRRTEHATSDPAHTQRTHTTGRHMARTIEFVVIGIEGTAGRVPIADEARGRLPSLDGALASGLPVGGRRAPAIRSCARIPSPPHRMSTTNDNWTSKECILPTAVRQCKPEQRRTSTGLFSPAVAESYVKI